MPVRYLVQVARRRTDRVSVPHSAQQDSTILRLPTANVAQTLLSVPSGAAARRVVVENASRCEKRVPHASGSGVPATDNA